VTVLLLVGAVVLIWRLSDKTKVETDGETASSTPRVSGGGGLVIAGQPTMAGLDPQEAPLFRNVPGQTHPRIRLPLLQRLRSVGFDLPRLSARGGKVSPAPDAGKLSLAEIKNAVTFIKVGTGEGSGSGSGFVIRVEGNDALVATNCHVVASALVQQARKGDFAPVDVVFDSGQSTERTTRAKIVGVDVQSDLALLRVQGVAKLPRAIDPRFTPKLTETQSVLICGFPFGGALATGSRSPSVTIGKGAISSIRHDDAGDVAMVQIDGSLNPGNSGGPIVDPEGRLVGIAVATIKGTGIGMAIPPADLLKMLEGRIHTPRIQPAGTEGNSVQFLVQVPLADPLRKIRSLSLNYATLAGKSSAPAADGSWPALEAATKVQLKLEGRAASALLRLLARDSTTYALQLACEMADGSVVRSRPVPFRLTVDAEQTAEHAMSLDVLSRLAPGFAGKTVLVQANLFPAFRPRGSVFEMLVCGENNEQSEKLRFLADPQFVVPMGELAQVQRMLPVRLTCRVGTPGGGISPLRVMQIEFLGRGNRVIKTLPEGE
jgi:S1-C subfamily serine protease